MSLWDRVTNMIAVGAFQENAPPLETRSDSIEDLVARLGFRAQPWRIAGVKEALGVPAIFRAVSFIATTVGALSLQAWRNGSPLPDADRPRIIVRPNPFTTPRDFFRDTAWSMATRGEAWWYVAKRDPLDGSALSLWPVNPVEIIVSEDPRDPIRPIIEWRGVRMRNEDMIQITMVRDAGDLRGRGPLQWCDAAVSVAVEAQNFAANFYAEGGFASTLIKAAGYLGQRTDEGIDGEHEADAMRAQWINSPNNVPRVIDQAIESVEERAPDAAGVQMISARDWQNGEAAKMFGLPGSFLDFAVAGSSLTYQNIGQELDKVTRTCLWPYYLEPIEQTMSDLLTRSTIARFNVDALLRADIKTRYEVHGIAIDKGIYDAEKAGQIEGFAPGDVENAPIPFAVPAAVPASLPFQVRSVPQPVRCDGTRVLRGILRPCGKLLAEAGPFQGTCRRCGKEYRLVA